MCATMCLCDMNVCRPELLKASDLYNRSRGQRDAAIAQVRKLKLEEKRKNTRTPNANQGGGRLKRTVGKKHCCT